MNQSADRQAPFDLPPALRQREVPGARLPLAAIACAGRFASQPAQDRPGSNGTVAGDRP